METAPMVLFNAAIGTPIQAAGAGRELLRECGEAREDLGARGGGRLTRGRLGHDPRYSSRKRVGSVVATSTSASADLTKRTTIGSDPFSASLRCRIAAIGPTSRRMICFQRAYSAVRMKGAASASAAGVSRASRHAPRSRSSQMATGSPSPIAGCAATTSATAPNVQLSEAVRYVSLALIAAQIGR